MTDKVLRGALTCAGVTMVFASWLGCGGSDNGPGRDSSVESYEKESKIHLKKMSDDALEYCSKEGACQNLPYDGSCVNVTISIDLRTGQTCETCTYADSAIEGTCGSGSGRRLMDCEMVTLPEPDCVVCAYVNGAILFSNCTAPEPECFSDWDCRGPAGTVGFCDEGQCTYVPGCWSDADCPNGYWCDYGTEPVPNPRSETSAGHGTVSDGTGSSGNGWSEERSGNQPAYGSGTGSQGSQAGVQPVDPPLRVPGVCEPVGPRNPCAAVECAQENECVVQSWDPPRVACVPRHPQPIDECETDADCPPDHVCERIWENENPTGNSPTETRDAPGETVRTDPDPDPNTDPDGRLVCIPAETLPYECRPGDCPPNNHCRLHCEGPEPVCRRVCIPFGPPVDECVTDANCPLDHICELICEGQSPTEPGAGRPTPQVSCGHVCMPVAPMPVPEPCSSDQDCVPRYDEGRGFCVDGECAYGEVSRNSGGEVPVRSAG